MAGFLQENWGSILVGAIVAATAALIIIKLIRDRKAGKGSCGGSCGCCPGRCAGCSAFREDRNE